MGLFYTKEEKTSTNYCIDVVEGEKFYMLKREFTKINRFNGKLKQRTVDYIISKEEYNKNKV